MIQKNQLGFIVTDIVTGFTGVATSYHEKLTAPQVGISPRVKENKPDKLPDAMCFDVDTVQPNFDKCIVPQVDPVGHSFSLLDQVEDDVTGFTGKITQLNTFLNGCVLATVAPRVDKEGNEREAKSFPVQRLKLIKKEEKPAERVNTGGPSEKRQVY